MIRPKLTMAIAAALLGAGAWFAASEARAEPNSWQALDQQQEILAFGQMRIPRWLAETVVKAAHEIQVDPTYVMALADKESSFIPGNKARTSSAEGLFQFTEATWLETLRAHGASHGFGAAAAAISIVDGRHTVTDPADRPWILNLRRDPYLSALMAAELARTSRDKLATRTERSPTEGELYLAHFLGVNGAARLMKLVVEKPRQNAPKAFPSAARANRTVFYRQGAGKRRQSTIAEVHARLDAMIGARLERYQSFAASASGALAAAAVRDNRL